MAFAPTRPQLLSPTMRKGIPRTGAQAQGNLGAQPAAFGYHPRNPPNPFDNAIGMPDPGSGFPSVWGGGRNFVDPRESQPGGFDNVGPPNRTPYTGGPRPPMPPKDSVIRQSLPYPGMGGGPPGVAAPGSWFSPGSGMGGGPQQQPSNAVQQQGGGSLGQAYNSGQTMSVSPWTIHTPQPLPQAPAVPFQQRIQPPVQQPVQPPAQPPSPGTSVPGGILNLGGDVAINGVFPWELPNSSSAPQTAPPQQSAPNSGIGNAPIHTAGGIVNVVQLRAQGWNDQQIAQYVAQMQAGAAQQTPIATTQQPLADEKQRLWEQAQAQAQAQAQPQSAAWAAGTGGVMPGSQLLTRDEIQRYAQAQQEAVAAAEARRVRYPHGIPPQTPEQRRAGFAQLDAKREFEKAMKRRFAEFNSSVSKSQRLKPNAAQLAAMAAQSGASPLAVASATPGRTPNQAPNLAPPRNRQELLQRQREIQAYIARRIANRPENR